jgi:tetratricopeptide (TPR) repeat protein
MITVLNESPRRLSVGWRRGGGAARRWGLVLSLAALAVGGCTDQKTGYRELIDEGIREYEAGRCEDAVTTFGRAAAFDRERPEPSYYTGRCYQAMAEKSFRQGDTTGALTYCDRAVAYYDLAVGAFPGFEEAVRGKAEALKLKGRHAAAREVANWAVYVSGPQARKLILKARLCMASGDMDGAELALQQAVAVEPKNAGAQAELGLFYMRCRNDDKARETLLQAYELDPQAEVVKKALEHLRGGEGSAG